MMEDNLYSICRTCLSTDSNNLEDMYGTDIANMLNACYFLQVVHCFHAINTPFEKQLQLQVSETDGYPRKVCNHCKELILQSYNFKTVCENSQKILKKQWANANVSIF